MAHGFSWSQTVSWRRRSNQQHVGSIAQDRLEEDLPMVINKGPTAGEHGSDAWRQYKRVAQVGDGSHSGNYRPSLGNQPQLPRGPHPNAGIRQAILVNVSIQCTVKHHVASLVDETVCKEG